LGAGQQMSSASLSPSLVIRNCFGNSGEATEA